MKAILVSQIHSHWLASFLVSYRTTAMPYTTTHKTPSELFLQIKAMNKSVWAKQAKQKSYHDSLSKNCEYFVGKKVLEHNFGIEPHWAAGVIKERLDHWCTWMVKVDSGVLWHCNDYVGYLRPALGELLKQNKSVSPNTLLQLAHLISFQLSIQKSSQLLNRKCSVTRYSCNVLLGLCVTCVTCYLCYWQTISPKIEQ